MEIRIFDVSHGFCALLIADNGNVMLFDCGHNERTGFRPSDYLNRIGCRKIEHLIIQNFDEDHVSDLHNLYQTISIEVLYRNKSISHADLYSLKRNAGPLSRAMEVALDLHAGYVGDVTSPPVFPGLEFECFCNSYPRFQDTNNLSLVSFVHYDGMSIIFPGDLEKAGWNALLENPSFCHHLRRVNIFVASHHGRESGYCTEIFNYFRPDAVIISDKEIVHETQKQRYQQHTTGLPWNGGPERRYVFTTRSDGMISISKTQGRGYQIII